MWLPLTVIAYAFFAVSSLVDRHLLAGPLPKALVYAFYVGIGGGFAVFWCHLGFLCRPSKL
jgi:hypothetical protein